MNAIRYAAIASFGLLATICARTQRADWPNPHFAPFEQWKAAVLAVDSAALNSFYSTDPPAQVQVNSVMGQHASADVDFWLKLKPRDIKTEVVRNEPRHGHISYIFRAQVEPASGPVLNLTRINHGSSKGISGS